MKVRGKLVVGTTPASQQIQQTFEGWVPPSAMAWKLQVMGLSFQASVRVKERERRGASCLTKVRSPLAFWEEPVCLKVGYSSSHELDLRSPAGV